MNVNGRVLGTGTLLAVLATVCFAVVFVVGLVHGFDIKDLMPLGLAFFAAAHI